MNYTSDTKIISLILPHPSVISMSCRSPVLVKASEKGCARIDRDSAFSVFSKKHSKIFCFGIFFISLQKNDKN